MLVSVVKTTNEVTSGTVEFLDGGCKMALILLTTPNISPIFTMRSYEELKRNNVNIDISGSKSTIQQSDQRGNINDPNVPKNPAINPTQPTTTTAKKQSLSGTKDTVTWRDLEILPLVQLKGKYPTDIDDSDEAQFRSKLGKLLHSSGNERDDGWQDALLENEKNIDTSKCTKGNMMDFTGFYSKTPMTGMISNHHRNHYTITTTIYNTELIVRKYLISRCYEQTPQSSNQQPIEQFDVTPKPIGERRKTEESGYGSCESELENVEESDDENNSDDTNDDEVDEGEEELISPIQIQAAKYFHQIPNYGPGTPMHTLLNEINTDIYFIYGLFLKDAGGNIDTPFYIGVSGNPYRRSYQHHTHSSSETLRQFNEANKNNIVMRILYGGSMENCLFLETLFIKFDKLLNYNLKNAQSGESRTPPLFECNAVTGLDNLIQYAVENGVNVTPSTKTAPTTIEPFFKISPDYPMEFKALMEEIVQMDHYLYVLTIIDEHERIIKIFYIGITYSLEFRLYSHFLHCKKSNSPYCATLNKNLANVRMLVLHINKRPIISLLERCILKNKDSIKLNDLGLLNNLLYTKVDIPNCGTVPDWSTSLLNFAISNSKRLSKNDAKSMTEENRLRQNLKRRQSGIGVTHQIMLSVTLILQCVKRFQFGLMGLLTIIEISFLELRLGKQKAEQLIIQIPIPDFFV